MKPICQGCGAVIQTEDESKIGYAPRSALDREVIICKRCFRLKHYNEVQDVDLEDKDYLKMVKQIKNKNSLIVNIVDIFDFNGSFISNLPKFTGKQPIILIGNKVDLLPKSVNPNKVIQWLRNSCKSYGLQVEKVFLVSAAKGMGMKEAARGINSLRDGKDVYVVGSTNVGKSTFINHLIHDFSGEKEAITTSYFPGTTLGFIEIPLDDNGSLFDTPGVINRAQMAHYVSKNDLKVITPRKEIKPVVYQLNEGQTLFLAGLGRLDFESGGRHSFVCHFSNELYIHRTKLEQADSLYIEHVGELLSPPDEETKKILPPLVGYDFYIENDKTDIVYSGLGWVTVPEGGVKIRAYAPKGVAITTRPSLI